MNAIDTIAVPFTQAAAHFLWQGTALAFLALLIVKITKPSPKYCCAVYGIALLLAALCLPATFFLSESEVDSANSPASAAAPLAMPVTAPNSNPAEIPYSSSPKIEEVLNSSPPAIAAEPGSSASPWEPAAPWIAKLWRRP